MPDTFNAQGNLPPPDTGNLVGIPNRNYGSTFGDGVQVGNPYGNTNEFVSGFGTPAVSPSVQWNRIGTQFHPYDPTRVGSGIGSAGAGMDITPEQLALYPQFAPSDWRWNATHPRSALPAQGLLGMLGNSISNLFSGQPINAANWAVYNGSQQQFENRANAAADISQMNNVTNTGFGSNYTGTTQDEGHTMFNINPTGGGGTFGRIENGILTHHYSPGSGNRPTVPGGPSVAGLLGMAGRSAPMGGRG